MTWSLGIDFGTSYTVAATARDGAVATIDVESNGSNRIPSSVFVGADGEILVGTAAQHQAVFAPERYEPTPKRSLGEGELFLGDDLVPVADLAAAILRRVYTEACRQQGERAPSELRLTHPADWSEKRVSVLREAAERAGLPRAIFVAEPVAAAVRIALQRTEPGQHIAVYDFGGGTFDAAVLQRTAAGFEVAGPPAGRDPLGGEDIDRRIIGYLGKLLADDHAEAWAKLLNPPDVEWPTFQMPPRTGGGGGPVPQAPPPTASPRRRVGESVIPRGWAGDPSRRAAPLPGLTAEAEPGSARLGLGWRFRAWLTSFGPSGLHRRTLFAPGLCSCGARGRPGAPKPVVRMTMYHKFMKTFSGYLKQCSQPSATRWDFLTNHAHVLVCVAHDPGIRLRDVAPKPAGRRELLVRLAAP